MRVQCETLNLILLQIITVTNNINSGPKRATMQLQCKWISVSCCCFFFSSVCTLLYIAFATHKIAYHVFLVVSRHHAVVDFVVRNIVYSSLFFCFCCFSVSSIVILFFYRCLYFSNFVSFDEFSLFFSPVRCSLFLGLMSRENNFMHFVSRINRKKNCRWIRINRNTKHTYTFNKIKRTLNFSEVQVQIPNLTKCNWINTIISHFLFLSLSLVDHIYIFFVFGQNIWLNLFQEHSASSHFFFCL